MLGAVRHNDRVSQHEARADHPHSAAGYITNADVNSVINATFLTRSYFTQLTPNASGIITPVGGQYNYFLSLTQDVHVSYMDNMLLENGSSGVYTLIVIQASPPRILTFDEDFYLWPDGIAPVITQSPGKIDVITWIVMNVSDAALCVHQGNFY